MRRRWIPFLFCLSVVLFALRPSAAGGLLRVNEAATRVLLDDRQTTVALSFENSTNHPLKGSIKLELLDPQERVRASAERTLIIKKGLNTVSLPLSLSWPKAKEREELLWCRLRYRITPSPSILSTGVLASPVEGIISLSEITPDLFVVSIAAPPYVSAGTHYRAQVRAVHPITSRPVSNVSVQAEIKFEGDPKTVDLTASGTTDAEGYIALDFDLPQNLETDEGQLKVVAHRGELSQEAEADVRLNHTAKILTSTDKPLYQPGQTLHLRTLIFDPTKHAVSGAEATLKITDPEDTTIFRASLKTSRYGVASAEWPIPENTRLGDYSIKVAIEGGRYEDSSATSEVKISRYDLPNFTVNVKPDRAYYLPHQNAEVEVRADYLFGQPVGRGHVRVVRETERRWNYREQKWETEEADKYEGDTKADGRFVAHIDLTKEHEELAGEDYSRFRDINYAAYFTDPTTNRTEQRRFDLRLTKDAIHIYVIEGSNLQTKNLPLQFYVSTFYADGTPAPCEVAISENISSTPAQDSSPDQTSSLPLSIVRTNSYGVAKVSGLALRQPDVERASLNFLARDTKGATGRHQEDLHLDDHLAIRVETDKTLYREGEPIRAAITSSVSEVAMIVDVTREWKPLRSEMVQLHHGRASLTLPYSSDFDGEVTVSVYSKSGLYNNRGGDLLINSRTVLYPHDRDLRLDVQMSRAAYRPGEEAHAEFRVQTPEGHAADSALGVVVFDKAVEERARTDQETNAGYGFYTAYKYLSGDTSVIAGITRRDLDHLDLTKPLPKGLELVAEILLSDRACPLEVHGGDEYTTDPGQVFKLWFDAQFASLNSALEKQYTESGVYPTDEPALRRLLLASGINFDDLRDPWGMPYRPRFTVEGDSSVLRVVSAGADKRFDTTDDIVVATFMRPYFRFSGEAIDRAAVRYHARTGSFIRDEATLKSELQREGIDFDALRDPWGQPYTLQFGISNTRFSIVVQSGGPDERLEPDTDQKSDDVTVWTSLIDYTLEMRARVGAALDSYSKATGHFPRSDAELNEALRRSNIERGRLRDGWNRPLYVTIITGSYYADHVDYQNYAKYGEKARERIQITPVTQQVITFNLRSSGADGKEGTADDFNVVTFTGLVAEQSSKDRTPRPAPAPTLFSGATGAISGTVTDPIGAVIPNATVQAKNRSTLMIYETKSDASGKYILRNVPAGFYEVRIDSPGFKSIVFSDVPVSSSNVTTLNVTLEVGAVADTVTISAANVETADKTSLITSRQVANLLSLQPGAAAVKQPAQTSTPRLREYFPETLLWQPSLETDPQGHAQLDFKLADNITTWKMSVIGSTVDGEIGTVEKEIRAFQPFFVEHDPPRVLTAGDEIALPVVLRNYLDKSQAVELEIKPENWFTLLGPARQHAEIAAGDATRETFDFRAVSFIKDGKQRITAMGAQGASDAVEKPVTVHPDGEEMAETDGQVFSASGGLHASIPADAIKGTAHAELKIYPNLMAHVMESVEAILERPYGCGEQTISSAYPSLMVLRYFRKSGQEQPLAAKARRYVQLGYERLLSYRAPGGGFSYWGHGDPADPALTAYALRFLADAGQLITVDEDVVKETREWLIKQQREDGSWPAHSWGNKDDERRGALLTAFIARVLAADKSAPEMVAKGGARPTQAPNDSLHRALQYLSRRTDEIAEPYLIASYALAAFDAGEKSNAERAIALLRTLAHEEGATSYWALETNTPFYGWGLAGRLETTALAVQALARRPELGKETSASPQIRSRDELVERGVLFLLRNKDRYGVWLSTQATVNVLDALVALTTNFEPSGKTDVGDATRRQANSDEQAEIFINNQRVTSILLPPASQLANPISVDITQFLAAPGSNRIEIRRAAGASEAAAQVVTTYYVPWSKSATTNSAATGSHHAKGEASSALRLAVNYDKTQARTGEETTCRVEAERIGFHGYGMMLAEVGLPPGADLDRASLERAMKESDWGLTQYDLLPDRLIVYLWPRAGGTRFTFKFRPRFGLAAQTAPSVLYDYYNPEARTVVAPTKFVVR